MLTKTLGPMIRLAVVIVAVALLGAACGKASIRERIDAGPPRPAAARATTAVSIEVYGTPGLRFEGAYGELGETQHVTGTVPTTLKFETTVGFTVALQKRSPQGELGIKITSGGRVINQASTKKAFGLVTFTKR